MKLVWPGEQRNQAVGLLAGIAIGLLFLYFPPIEVAKLLLVVGAVVVLAGNYFLGLLLVPFALPFLPNLAYTMLLALVLGAFLLRVLWDGSLHLRVPANPFLYLFLALLFFSALSSITLGYSLREFLLHCLGWGIVLALTSSLTQRRRVKIFLLAMVLAAVLVSLYGIYGYYIGIPGESGWVDAQMHPELTTRAFSTFGNPNVLAEYLVFVLPFSLALAWYHRDWSQRLLYGGATALQVLCLVLTMSRSGWLAFAAGMAVFAVLLDRRLIWVGLGLGILSLPVLLNSDVFLQRLLSIFSLKDSSNVHRIVVWQETLVMIREFWATGVGLGHRAFRFLYPYFAFDRSKFPYHSHNTYLQVAVETGLFGLAALLLYLGSVLKGTVRQIFGKGHPFDRTMLVAAAASLAGIMVFGLFESVLYLPKIIIMFWTVLGITLALLEIRGSSFEIRNGE
ncbi:MAG: O-antigen ligase family protein [bacterium]|jgi:putative inorganic carbon (HCO3(-)) transporter